MFSDAEERELEQIAAQLQEDAYKLLSEACRDEGDEVFFELTFQLSCSKTVQELNRENRYGACAQHSNANAPLVWHACVDIITVLTSCC